MKLKKTIPIILILSVVLSCVVWIWMQHTAPEGKTAEIRISGKIVNILDLSKDTKLTIEGKNVIVLNIVVSNGKIRVLSSKCPDKICVNQGWVSYEGTAIVCLPAETVIEITGNSPPATDA